MLGGAVLGDPKNAHLKQLDGAADRLRLFKDDVLDRAALATAVEGCDCARASSMSRHLCPQIRSSILRLA
jgi:hypothetical protein